MDQLDARVARVARSQFGLITWAQAKACELTPAMIRARRDLGRWESVHPGVYRIAGAPLHWRATVLGACLSSGLFAVASHVTAGVLWRLIERERPPVEVTVPYGKGPDGLGFVVHRTRITCDPQHVGPVPVTSPRRTLLDLAGCIRPSELEEALDTALHRKLVHVDDLDRFLATSGGSRKGSGRLRAFVDERAGRRHHAVGKFATRFGRILANAGLPQPELEYDVRRDDGHLLGTVDIGYPNERVFVELDGWEWHSSRQKFDRDHIRRNLIVEMGYVPLGFTWTDLRQPRYVAGTVRRVLKDRGHPSL